MNTYRLLLAAVVTAAPCALAVETQSWIHNAQSDFEKGTIRNLSLRSDGRLTLAPEFRELADPSIAYLWAVAVDSKGTVWAGGGGPSASTAVLVAVDAAGRSRTVAEIPGLQIQAIAIDRKDRVFVATLPDGKVYRIGVGGKPEVFYDPKAKYIWALAFNSKGELFVATGDAGEIHRVGPDGQGAVFFRTEETHARSLAVDANDNLIVGTEPGGLIVRISPAGEGFVLFQTAKREVTALAVAKDGSIYAAAVGNKAALPPGGVPSLSVPLPAVNPQTSVAPGGTPAQPRAATTAPVQLPPPPSASAAPGPIAGGSEVYGIGADGYPQKVWTHAQDVVYSIGFDASGRPVVATGNKGNIYRIDSERVSTLLVNASPTQVTGLASGPQGRLFAVTGNVGKIYQIGPKPEKQGTYESEPLDVGFFSYWGRARHKTELHGGAVRLETRSGNLDRPQKNWSPWAPLDASTSRVTSPSARFLQYRITIEGGGPQSPELREVEIAYMPKNVPPALQEIEITPANYKFNAPSLLATSSSPQTITLPALGQQNRAASTLKLDASSTSQTLQYAKGSAGVRWAVTDPNGDEMTYKVEIRGVQEREWKLLKDKLKEKYYSWDSTAYPDGEYLVRVTACDAPDNPPDQALSATLESERFTIDNTPPQITGLAGKREGSKVTVEWKAKDARSLIQKAEYSVNGGEWVVVQPSTRLSDASELDYKATIESPGAESTVAVRVTDEFDNQSVEKVILR